MQEIIHSLPIIAASDSNVLIQGESGTGKELVARAVHVYSHRKKGPFVAVNCSAIPETLIESELFGYERGAFTGAVTSKPGRFELAKGGTLFLDEIGDLKPEIQVKLLRVLEEKAFMRVGGTRKIPLEARLVAATNVDLKEAMRRGRFRDDLYYRLFTVPIFLPPLRDKREDIPILVKYILENLNRKFNKRIKGVDPKVMKLFCRHPWPGNVRELQHVLEYCFVFAKGGFITQRHLPRLESAWVGRELELPQSDDSGSPLRDLEKRTIVTALEMSQGSKQDAARRLKISRSKLWRKMKIYGITDADFKK
jgi:transcriptional regulator with PAS, ATPase and Fis domain